MALFPAGLDYSAKMLFPQVITFPQEARTRRGMAKDSMGKIRGVQEKKRA
jgi:hypothetical protein